MPRSKDKLAQALNIGNLPAPDREEILKKVDERLNKVLIGVLVSNITEEDAGKIMSEMNGGGDLEEAVAQISARIPGLAGKIERAISEEILRLKAVLKQGQ